MAKRNRFKVPRMVDLIKYRVVERVAFKWEELALSLGLDDDGTKVAVIKRDFINHGVQYCCLDVFLRWLRGEGEKSITWDILLTVLRDLEFSAIAEEIEEKLFHEKREGSSGSSSFPTFDPSTIDDASNLAEDQYDFNMPDELREYQWELAMPGLSGQNYIVCAPTGSGKTRIAGVVISEHLKERNGKGYVVFLVNKVPLVHQQALALQDMIPGAKIQEITGEASQYRKAMFSGSSKESETSNDKGVHFQPKKDIVVCTAGCLLNELSSRQMRLSTISLLVIDECHNTRKKTDYAKIMEMYLQEKASSEEQPKLPQVMGLSATPGAGDSNRPSLQSVIEHLLTLCALLDASGGIKTVKRNLTELESHQISAVHTSVVSEGRSEDEFISTITKIMAELEGAFCTKKRPPVDVKWGPKYTGWVSTTLQEYQAKNSKRDMVSILKTLKCLSGVLNVYQDLRFEDAMAVLETADHIPSDEGATCIEKKLSECIKGLKVKLRSFKKVENPLLVKLEDILLKKFQDKPETKAIVFVETKNQATSIHQWILSKDTFRRQNINADVVTGQTRDTGKMMTKAEQSKALEGFRNDEYNLLVSTSVLEEGIDVPACNLVIRYQKVTSEIAQVQSKGRARASQSQSFSIVSSDSGKRYQELLNEEKIMLVDQALDLLLTGENLSYQLKKKQETILMQAEIQASVKEDRKHLYSPFQLQLQCLHCSAFMCNGSDVHIVPNTKHHVITDRTFLERVLVKDHHDPAKAAAGIHKIYCGNCTVGDFGVLGRWWNMPREYPVIKCTSIKFVDDKGETIPCKKWMDAPFEISVIQ